jgi:hypothetical protein
MKLDHETSDPLKPYRIGWKVARLNRRPWHIWHRPWQSEASDNYISQPFARRAFTATGARRKMLRDVQHHQHTGERSRYQRTQSWFKRVGLR